MALNVSLTSAQDHNHIITTIKSWLKNSLLTSSGLMLSFMTAVRSKTWTWTQEGLYLISFTRTTSVGLIHSSLSPLKMLVYLKSLMCCSGLVLKQVCEVTMFRVNRGHEGRRSGVQQLMECVSQFSALAADEESSFTWKHTQLILVHSGSAPNTHSPLTPPEINMNQSNVRAQQSTLAGCSCCSDIKTTTWRERLAAAPMKPFYWEVKQQHTRE